MLSTTQNLPSYLGAIEGFFGREWTWQARKAYADFFALNQLNFYIYAPKGDKNLRSNWQQNWATETQTQLHELRNHYRDAGVDFGIGLSPHEIYLDHSKQSRENLKTRIQQINQYSPEIFCILFDDMRGDIPNLSTLQIDLIHLAAETSTAKKIIACPTYYSFDPVLEKVFGKMPQSYWEVFAKDLDPTINLFWTGEKVCSPEYSVQHLQKVTELFNRKPFLWDNYPVNDGAAKAKHIYMQAVPNAHAELTHYTAGHACNPMNESALSQVALASLAQAYLQGKNYARSHATESLLITLCGEQLGTTILNDIPLFEQQGLDKFDSILKQDLIRKYSTFTPNLHAQEIIEWLTDEYRFDPSCLTG